MTNRRAGVAEPYATVPLGDTPGTDAGAHGGEGGQSTDHPTPERTSKGKAKEPEGPRMEKGETADG